MEKNIIEINDDKIIKPSKKEDVDKVIKELENAINDKMQFEFIIGPCASSFLPEGINVNELNIDLSHLAFTMIFEKNKKSDKYRLEAINCYELLEHLGLDSSSQYKNTDLKQKIKEKKYEVLAYLKSREIKQAS